MTGEQTTVDPAAARTASEEAIRTAVQSNNVEDYMRALSTHPDYAVLFEGGINSEVAQGLRADFAADYQRSQPGAQTDWGNSLQSIWDAFTRGDWGALLQSVMGIFNSSSAGQQIAAHDRTVEAGRGPLQNLDTAGAVPEQPLAAYNAIIGRNGPA